MDDHATRFARFAGAFTDRVEGVPPGAWENPAPCEGWVARDVVRHMVEWMPGMLETGTGIRLPTGPSVDDDPLGAWLALSDGIQAVLDDPDLESKSFSHPMAGDHPL